LNSNTFLGIFLFTALAVLIGYGLSFAEQKNFHVEITANPKSGQGPMWVHLKPKVANLKEPLKFRWFFGDGEESNERIPQPHQYQPGRYYVALEVTDRAGKLYTASITVEAFSSQG